MKILAARAGVIALTIALGAAQTAVAGQTNGALPVSATDVSNCVLDAGVMAFGYYDLASVNGPGGANVALTVNLDQGLHPAGGSTDGATVRQMQDGACLRCYNLYTGVLYTVHGRIPRG